MRVVVDVDVMLMDDCSSELRLTELVCTGSKFGEKFIYDKHELLGCDKHDKLGKHVLQYDKHESTDEMNQHDKHDKYELLESDKHGKLEIVNQFYISVSLAQ